VILSLFPLLIEKFYHVFVFLARKKLGLPFTYWTAPVLSVTMSHIVLTETKSIPALTVMMSLTALTGIKFIPVLMGIMLPIELTAIRFIREVMGMMLRIGLEGRGQISGLALQYLRTCAFGGYAADMCWYGGA